MITNEHGFTLALWLIILGGLIYAKDSIGYTLFVVCLVINTWGSIDIFRIKNVE